MSKDEYYIFTFGCGMKHAGYYVRIKGTEMETRDKMMAKYGREWAFQYSESEWNKIVNDNNRWWEIEKELEVIE